MGKKYEDGMLVGQWQGDVLICAEAVRWLEHASKTTGYSIDRLIEIATEEAALNYAKQNKLV